MALEAITKLTRAENEAEDIINKAETLKTKIIKEAIAEANNEYIRIISDAKNEAETIIENAEKEALEETEPMFENGKKEQEDILSIPKDIIDKAVKFSVERIVNINGHS